MATPWWITIPFGAWPPGALPNPSPLENAVLNTLTGGGNDACFIDVMDLGDATASFMADPNAVTQIATSIIAAMNAVPIGTKCTVRFVQGGNGATPPDPTQSGFVQALWAAAGALRLGANATFYFGNFAPSIDTAGQSLPPEWTKLLTSLLNYVKSGLPQRAQWFFQQIEPWIVSWCERYLARVAQPVSWNHAKIFAVNGRVVVTGGANYWGEYATGSKGPFDMSMSIRGDAALAAQRFADYFWGYLNKVPANDQSSCGLGAQLTDPSMTFRPVPAPMFSGKPVNQGSVQALLVGKNGNCGLPPQVFPVQVVDALRDFILNIMGAVEAGDTGGLAVTVAMADWLSDDKPGFRNALINAGVNPTGWASRYARNAAIGASTTVLRLSQQKLVMDDLYASDNGFKALVAEINQITGCNWNGLIWPYDLFMAFARSFAAMSRNTNAVGLQLACSYYDPFANSYQDSITRTQFVTCLTQVMVAMAAVGQIAPLGNIPSLVNRLLVYKRLDYVTSGAHGNHSKMVIADDSVCFIGSDNAYPSYNQEVGFWLEDPASINGLLTRYWQPMWQYAQLATK
jgi:phosphatidylserine/phosphatidylglycerophosphate/cardiolipin synthase-like enzyme